MEDDRRERGDVLPPDDAEDDALGGVNILALVRNYTNRPDLFLAEVEKHDPGFINRMNESAAAHSARFRESRFSFGERQAYTSLVFRVVAVVVVLGALAYEVVAGGAGFWTIIALAIFYAVTQGGNSGFLKIVSALSRALTNLKK